MSIATNAPVTGAVPALTPVAIRTAASVAIASLAIAGHKTLTVAVQDINYGLLIGRPTKKATVYRDQAGLMLSGNPAERGIGFAHCMADAYVNGNYGTLARNVARVFPAIGESMGFLQMDANTGRVPKDAAMSSRAAWECIFDALVKKHNEKPFKGEKLSCLIGLQSARATFIYTQAEMQAEKAAELAAGTAPGIVDGETREVSADAPALSAPTDAAIAAELADAMGETGADTPAADDTAPSDAQNETAGADSQTA